MLRWSTVLRPCAAVVLVVAFAGGSAALATAGALPDGRGYELVSPSGKNGGDVIAEPSRTRAAVNGDAVSFVSLTAFGDAQGTGINAEYLSRRDGTPGTSGWSTHATLPTLEPVSLDAVTNGLDTFYGWEFSSDLSKGVMRTYTNLSGDPNVVNVGNLYLRNDLLSNGAGSFTLLTACPACEGVGPLDNVAPPNIGDATPDFGHIIFESRSNLVADAFGGAPKLYEWDHGEVRLAGVLPDGSVVNRTYAGAGASKNRYTPNTISDDGSKIFFTRPPDGISTSGELYMRVDHSSTVQINASERTDCAGDPTCGGDGIADPAPDPSGPLEAQYQTATPDGSKVFFTSSEILTDDNQGGSSLYMYDTTKPDSDAHNLTLISPDTDPSDGVDPSVDGVVDVSADGSYVYFTAEFQLVPGVPPVTDGSHRLYLWHDGTVRFVGQLTRDDATGADLIGGIYGLGQFGARVTPDGTRLLFTSQSGVGLTGYEQNTPECDQNENHPCVEMYLYDAPSDSLTCVSCNGSTPATRDASFTLSGVLGPTAQQSHLSHPLSSDGRYVFFTSGERLLPEDRNGKKRDVYEYDTATGALHLLSSGRGIDDSFFLDATPSGHDVYIATRDRLVGWDTDNAYDVYDVRVGGGFPEPVLAAPECAGDACRGALGSAPAFSAPLSTFFSSGNDNVKHHGKHKKRCKRGKVRKRVHGRVKCVKKHHGTHRNARGSR